jgi:hypothetical protein
LTTKTINTASTYNLKLTADKLTGCPASFATASITVNPVSLPVSFLSVNVQPNGNGALLTWTVANEMDVLRYEVERSNDCRNFTVKGQVAFKQAIGTTNTYSFTDNAVNGQDVCYRIKQIDLNGNVHYSRIVNLSGLQHSSTVVGPNPASHFITISKSSSVTEKITVSLVDMNGRLVYQRNVVLLPGMKSFEISNLEVFGKGQYVVQLLGSRTREYVKVVVE